MTFTQLGLDEALVDAVSEAGYDAPTPIQTQAIPAVLAGRDVLGCAQTGTGKTAAFALPILQLIDQRAGDEPLVRALIVSPTRELAAQIGESFGVYGKHLDLLHTVVFGGVNDKPQIKKLRSGVDILVATPGRLLDLVQQRALSLRDVEVFVLDEADHMLDMGFLPSVRRICDALPRRRQTLLFSATMPPPIMQLADVLLHNPVKLAVARVAEPAELVDQRILFVDTRHKRELLVDLLRRPELRRTIVFCRTKHGANRIARHLERAKVPSAAIHGDKSQGARLRALAGFKSGSLNVLVATDIAARGIDVDGVSHVINYDLPNVPETYVHRIGRTARAGASGVAYSFCDAVEQDYLIDIERLIQRHIPRVEDHRFPSEAPAPPQTRLTGARPKANAAASGPTASAGTDRSRTAGTGRSPAGRRAAGPAASKPNGRTRRRSGSSSSASSGRGGATSRPSRRR
ncbi:MAG: DEAD/DEAH box helicase [Myxococcales bacterium FL481]|nr:MAG: DEAD/DEAH box helicase [Myxococcales bacterium FL481]